MRSEGSIKQQPAAFPTPPSIGVVDVSLALIDYEHALDWIDSMIDRRQRGYVCVCNVHTVMASSEDVELREALGHSSMNLPDGQPLVWAIKALGHSLAGPRVRT